MSKIVIYDDTGETYESEQYIAVLLQKGGEVLGLAEDGRLEYEERVAFLIQGAKLFGELASWVNPDKVEEEKGG